MGASWDEASEVGRKRPPQAENAFVWQVSARPVLFWGCGPEQAGMGHLKLLKRDPHTLRMPQYDSLQDLSYRLVFWAATWDE